MAGIILTIKYGGNWVDGKRRKEKEGTESEKVLMGSGMFVQLALRKENLCSPAKKTAQCVNNGYVGQNQTVVER